MGRISFFNDGSRTVSCKCQECDRIFTATNSSTVSRYMSMHVRASHQRYSTFENKNIELNNINDYKNLANKMTKAIVSNNIRECLKFKQ